MKEDKRLFWCAALLALVFTAQTSEGKKEKPIQVQSRHNEFDHQWTHIAEDWIKLVDKAATVRVRPFAIDKYRQDESLYGLAVTSRFSKCMDVDVIKWQIDGSGFEAQVAGYDSDYSSSRCTTSQYSPIEPELWYALGRAERVRVRLETDEGFLESSVAIGELDRLRRSIAAVDAKLPQRVAVLKAEDDSEVEPESAADVGSVLSCDRGHEYAPGTTFEFCPEDGLPLRRAPTLRCQNGHSFDATSNFKFCPEDGLPLTHGGADQEEGESGG